MEWLNENLELILGGTGVATFVTLLYYRFASTVIPKFLLQVQKLFIVLISNLLGVSFGEGTDIVERLPLLSQLDDFSQDLKTNNYMKLIELKKEVNSPLYNEIEKINLIAAYDVLYNRLKAELPAEIQAVLDQLDAIEVGE